MRDELTEVCNVLVRARDTRTGQVIAERIGHNVWTNTGREYSCLLKTYDANDRPYRDDRIKYVGLGIGTQPETVNVNRLVTPVQYEIGTFLKPIALGRTSFQVSGGVRTAVRYSCTFLETDITFGGAGSILISECGLFTDGDIATNVAGTRDRGLNSATSQAPVAYHTFDPIPKTSTIQLELIWELRH
jgi:hypothetical protein